MPWLRVTSGDRRRLAELVSGLLGHPWTADDVHVYLGTGGRRGYLGVRLNPGGAPARYRLFFDRKEVGAHWHEREAHRIAGQVRLAAVRAGRIAPAQDATP